MYLYINVDCLRIPTGIASWKNYQVIQIFFLKNNVIYHHSARQYTPHTASQRSRKTHMCIKQLIQDAIPVVGRDVCVKTTVDGVARSCGRSTANPNHEEALVLEFGNSHKFYI